MSFSKYVIEFADKLAAGVFTKEIMNKEEGFLHNMVSMLLKDSLKSEAGMKMMDRIYNSLREEAQKSQKLEKKAADLEARLREPEDGDSDEVALPAT